MAKNMTEGNPAKLILQFALPFLLGNLLQQTYNMFDAAIVGKVLGSDALASVGASSSVQFLVLGFCTGTCAGFGVPLARVFGSGDYKRLRQYIYHAYMIAAVFAAVITAVTALLCPGILHLLKTPENIFENAYIYLLIIFLGIPFTLLYNMLASILRAVGDSKTPFIFLAVSTLLNIALDTLFIVYFRMGCSGAAIATITSQAVSGISCYIYIQKRYPLLRIDTDAKVFNRHVGSELICMGVPMGLQFSITAIGSMVMQSANNGLGSIYVSGFTAGSKIKQFGMSPFEAVGTGVSVYAGQNLGAGKTERISKGVWSGLAIGIVYGLFIGAVMMIFGRSLSLMFVKASDTEVLAAATKYVFWQGVFFWVFSFLFTGRMTVQGLGYSGLAVFAGFLEMIARIFISKVFVPVYGFTAICFTDQSAWIVAAIYCCVLCAWCIKRVTKEQKMKNIIQ